MTEVNNNIHNYGYKIERIEPKKEDAAKLHQDMVKEEEHKYVPDPGVLGRSLVNSPNNGNIAKSVNETVEMAKNQPIRFECSNKFFENRYNHYIKSGLSEPDAYLKAAMEEEEFLDISSSYNR